jgi:hypothetical protein
MDMYQIIEAIKRGMNPNAAIQAALGGSGGPDGAATDPANPQPQPQPQPQPDPNAPAGAKTPFTNPADPATTPKVQQSPPDLANMYIELMKKSENARALDSNLSLIAAGFSKYPENRAALIKRAGGAGDQAMGLTPTDILNFDARRSQQQAALVRQQALPALMKQYGMTPAQIQYLESSDKLDEVVKHYSTENLGSATDQATGKTLLYNPRNGKVITELGGVKPEEGEFQDTPEGRRLVSKRSGEPMGAPLGAIPSVLVKEYEGINAIRAKRGEAPLSVEEYMKLKHPGASTKVEVNMDKNGVPYPAPEPGRAYERNADGTVKIGADGRPVQYAITGSGPAEKKEAADREQADKEKAERVKRVNQIFATSNIGEGVNKAFSVVDVPGVTGFGSNWARIFNPGGMSKNTFDAAKETIESGAAFKQLQQMREAAAASGGASGLGQVTEKENRMLASVIASIRWDQPTHEVKKALARLKAAFIVMAAEDVPEAELPKRVSDMADQILVEEANKANAAKGIKSTIKRVN